MVVCSILLSCASNQVASKTNLQASLSAQTQLDDHDEKIIAKVKPSGNSIGSVQPAQIKREEQKKSKEYTLGIEDVIQIDLIKPEPVTSQVAVVAPDGQITFPYIGNVLVKDRTISQVQTEIQSRLAKGYMKYPVVAVSLKASRSRKFFIYGEVAKPGDYQIEENMTTLRAISMAGGFNRFGSSSRVKVLRPKKNGPGYIAIKVNIKAVMEGNSDEDLLLTKGDIVVVSEGLF